MPQLPYEASNLWAWTEQLKGRDFGERIYGLQTPSFTANAATSAHFVASRCST
jgi:hypothetical protein